MPKNETVTDVHAKASSLPSPSSLAPIAEEGKGEEAPLKEWNALDPSKETPILNFRKRPDEEEEEEETKAAPLAEIQSKARDEGEAPYHWEVTLSPRLLTTNTGIVQLTTELQSLFDAIVRGMLEDRGTPIHHPAVLGYINMHGACEQIKQVFRPQQVQLSPQQIAEMQRQAKLGLS